MALSLLSSGPSDAPAAFLFAHGAGAPEDSPFMEAIAEGLADRGWRVHRFAFPYMRRSRETGRRCPPDRAPVLQQDRPRHLVRAPRLEDLAPVPTSRVIEGGKTWIADTVWTP